MKKVTLKQGLEEDEACEYLREEHSRQREQQVQSPKTGLCFIQEQLG